MSQSPAEVEHEAFEEMHHGGHCSGPRCPNSPPKCACAVAVLNMLKRRDRGQSVRGEKRGTQGLCDIVMLTNSSAINKSGTSRSSYRVVSPRNQDG